MATGGWSLIRALAEEVQREDRYDAIGAIGNRRVGASGAAGGR